MRNFGVRSWLPQWPMTSLFLNCAYFIDFFFLPLLTLSSTFSLFNYGKKSKPIALYFKIKTLSPQVTPISRRAAHTFWLPRSSLLRNKIESISLCKPHANKRDIWPNAIFRTKLLLLCHQNNFWQSNLHFQHDSCHVRRPLFTRPWQWLQLQPETLSCCVPSTLLASASHPFCCSFSASYFAFWPQLLGCFVIIVSPTGECQSVWSTQTSCLSESLRRAATAACINCLTSWPSFS